MYENDFKLFNMVKKNAQFLFDNYFYKFSFASSCCLDNLFLRADILYLYYGQLKHIYFQKFNIIFF